MWNVLGKAPILPAAVGIVVGILAYEFLPFWAVIPVLACAVGLFVMKWRWTAAVMLFVAVEMCLCGIMRPTLPPEEALDKRVVASARISGVRENSQSVGLLVTVDSIQHVCVSPFKAQVTVNTVVSDFEPGQRISLVTVFATPQSEPFLPGDPDMRLYFKAEGITATAYCNDYDCHVTAPAPAFTGSFNCARQELAEAIIHASVSPDCASFLLATLLGDDALLAPSTLDDFRRSGISHVLALSGLHVGIIVMIVMMLSLPFNIPRWGFYVRPVIAIVLVWAYAMLVGLPPSVVRAAIMTTVYMLARMIQRGHTGFNSLVVSIVFILAIRPMWLYSVGFQLSVVAVASILAFTPLVPSRWRKHPVRYFLLMSLIVPVAAMLGTGLIAAIHYSSFPMLFLPANIVVGLLVPWILGLGVALAVFSLFGWHLTVIGWLTTKLYALLTLAINLLSSVPGATVQGLDIPAVVVIPYLATVVFIWLAMRLRSWKWGVSALGAFFLTWLCGIAFTPAPAGSELYVLPDKDATKVILTISGAPMLILPDAKTDTAEAVKKVARQHGGYLNLRRAEAFTLSSTPRQIAAGGRKLRFISDASDTVPDSIAPTYLLVCKGYTGKIARTWRTLRPDTVLLSPALNPKISRRLIKECGDSIPIRNLRDFPFKIKQVTR